VIQFAKKTGDYSALSHPDLCVLALTYALDKAERERNAQSHTDEVCRHLPPFLMTLLLMTTSLVHLLASQPPTYQRRTLPLLMRSNLRSTRKRKVQRKTSVPTVIWKQGQMPWNLLSKPLSAWTSSSSLSTRTIARDKLPLLRQMMPHIQNHPTPMPHLPLLPHCMTIQWVKMMARVNG
jgi:hypothetical protein